MKRERIQDISTLKALNKAFTKNCLPLLPTCTVYIESTINDSLPYGAQIVYVSEIPVPDMPETIAKKIGLKNKTIQGVGNMVTLLNITITASPSNKSLIILCSDCKKELNNKNALIIRRLRERGWTHKKISALYKVSRGTITQILSGTIWSHIQ